MDQERPWERDEQLEAETMRKRIEEAYSRGGGNRSGLEPVMKQIIKELERIETLASPSPSAAAKAEQPEGTVGEMTPDRAIYFLKRFKRDEKMLGPHEQWALDLSIASLSAQVQDVAGWEKREREARAKALEEAAKVAEDKAQAWSTSKGGEIDACLDTAAAIRALQSEEP